MNPTCFVFVALVYGANFITCEEPSSSPIAQLSTGILVDTVNVIAYESTVPLIYEMELPDLDQWTRLLTPLNDTGIGQILNSTHSLALRLLPIFPSPNSTRRRRSIEVIGDFYNWCCGVAQQKSVNQLQLNE